MSSSCDKSSSDSCSSSSSSSTSSSSSKKCESSKKCDPSSSKKCESKTSENCNQCDLSQQCDQECKTKSLKCEKKKKSSLRLSLSQKNIVSSTDGVAKFTDSNLVNPWGIVIVHQGSSAWVANNGSATLTRYNLKTGQARYVSTPLYPTGIVLNQNRFGFFVTSGMLSRSSQIILVTEDGLIAAYNQEVDENNAIVVVDNARALANYKGVTQIGKFLYVANFYSGLVEQYDEKFGLVSTFTDSALLNLGYAPYNVANICNNLFVAYAKQDGGKQDEVKGAGNGYIDVYDNDGNFKLRFASRGALNAPWAMVPLNIQKEDDSDKCGDSNKCDESIKCVKKEKLLLVGNFGDGTINVFNFKNGHYLTSLKDKHGNILSIDGLWGLETLECSSLLFAAGSDDEQAGVLGKLKLL